MEAAATRSPREVPVEDSRPGVTGAGAGVGATYGLKPPGRRFFTEQFDLTPNRDGKIQGMEKNIADI